MRSLGIYILQELVLIIPNLVVGDEGGTIPGPHSEHDPDDDDWADDHDLKTTDKTVFSIGQDYDEAPAKTLQCRHCGSTEFNVGSGNHWTGVKCVCCGKETEVHSG